MSWRVKKNGALALGAESELAAALAHFGKDGIERRQLGMSRGSVVVSGFKAWRRSHWRFRDFADQG